MNESFKTDPSLATSARAAKESGSYLCASNVTPTLVRFIVSVFLCLLCSCRMSSTQMTCSHFRKNRPKKRQKPAGCRLRIISKNRPVTIFGRSTGASLLYVYSILGRGLFCFNYCLNSAWHGGDQFVALLRWYGSPGFFDCGLQLICIFWSLVSHFPLDNNP